MYDYLVNKDAEDTILDSIDKEKLYKYIKSLNFNMKKFFGDFKLITTKDMLNFNILLRKVKIDLNYDIFDILIFFEKDYFPIQKILYLIDTETKSILRDEVAKRFNIKWKKSKLFKLFL